MTMNDKEIHGHLAALLDAFLITLPASLQLPVRDNAFFAGGCIASLLRGEPAKDYDLFLQDKAVLDKLGDELMDRLPVQVFDSRDPEVRQIPMEQPAHFPVGYSKYAITLEGGIQVILSRWGPKADVLATFDFEHCTASWDTRDGLVIPGKARAAIMNSKLAYRPGPKAIQSVERIMRFTRRGWFIDRTNTLLVLGVAYHQIKEMDPELDYAEFCDMLDMY